MPFVVAVPKDKPLPLEKLGPIATIDRFAIPQLKIGTYDKLVQLSDDLEKVSVTIESTTARLLKQMLDSRKRAGTDINQPILVGNPKVGIEEYLKKFRWADDKYPLQMSLRAMVDDIVQKVTNYANQLQGKMNAYQKLTAELTGLSSKSSGTLMSRDLTPPLVEVGDFIEQAGSEYCSSVFVIVQKQEVKNFEEKIKTLSNFAIYPTDPHDAQGNIRALRKDDQYALYVLWACKDSATPEAAVRGRNVPDTLTPMSELLKKLKENRWTYKTGVEFDPEAAKAAKEREFQLQKEKENEDLKNMRWIDAVFADAYMAYAHLKAVSTFVEAVLRYGLAGKEPNYVAHLIWPRPKKEDAVRKELQTAFGGQGKDQGQEDDEAAMISRKEYFPYVSETISLLQDEE